MADFKTHVTFSSAIGCGYAVIGSGMGYDLTTSLVAGGLCGVSGMLPDVDSDSGVPRREALGFAAAIVPMLLIDRFKQFNLSHDQVILIGAALYFGIRFTAADLIGRWSVHRGMWHSIPAVLIFAGLAFLITGSTDLSIRYFKAVAVALGAFSHLVLDEIYSVDTRGVVPKFKKSFGTAIKLWSKDGWANFSTYAKLVVIGYMILMESSVMSWLEERNPALAGHVQRVADHVQGAQDRIASIQGEDSPTGDKVVADPPSTTGPSRELPVGSQQTIQPVQPPAQQPALPYQAAPPYQAALQYQPAPSYQASPQYQSQYPANVWQPVAPPNAQPQGFLPNRSDALR